MRLGKAVVETSKGGTSPQVFLTSGTFTPPAGVTAVAVYMSGGGGGGGGGGVQSINFAGGSGGGGGGGHVISTSVSVTPLTPISITIGAGGSSGAGGSISGGSGATGGTGGTTFFGSTFAGGGIGGAPGFNGGNGGNGGLGGSGGGGGGTTSSGSGPSGAGGNGAGVSSPSTAGQMGTAGYTPGSGGFSVDLLSAHEAGGQGGNPGPLNSLGVSGGGGGGGGGHTHLVPGVPLGNNIGGHGGQYASFNNGLTPLHNTGAGGGGGISISSTTFDPTTGLNGLGGYAGGAGATGYCIVSWPASPPPPPAGPGTISLPGVTQLCGDGTNIWASVNQTPSYVAKITPYANAIDSTISLGGAGTIPGGIVYVGGGFLWLNNSGFGYNGTIMKVSVETSSVVTSIGNRSGGSSVDPMTYQNSFLWGFDGSLGLVQLDPNTGAETGPSSLTLGGLLTFIYANGFMWGSGGISGFGGGTIFKFDPNTLAVVSSIPSGATNGASGPEAYDGTSVWFSRSDGTHGGNSVFKVNATTDVVSPDITVGSSPWGLVFDGTFIWVASGRNGGTANLYKIDPGTDTIVSTTSLPSGSGSYSMIYQNGFLWIACAGTGEIIKMAV